MLSFQIGDATHPPGSGPRVIVHIVNDAGAWGRGFVIALSRRFTEPERRYRAWASGEDEPGLPFVLGQVQFVEVEAQLWVANLVGQHDIARKSAPQTRPPVRYDAVGEGLERVRRFALEHGASVHMPRLAAGLAGGDWSQKRWCSRNWWSTA